MSDFAENLRKAIFNQRCKAVDIARATNITPSVISRYLSGMNQPSTANLFAIANYLGMSPNALLSSSDAPELGKPVQNISSHQDKIIELLERMIAEREGQIKKLEEALGKKTTPDEVLNRLFDLIDQSDFYSARAIGSSGGLDESDEDHKWIQSEIDRVDAEINALRSMFFSEEDIQERRLENFGRASHRAPRRSRGGRPRKPKK